MAYTLQPDEQYDDPRLAKCDLEHHGLIACGRSYIGRHLTDGKIPKAQVPKFGTRRRGARVAADLVAFGVYRDDGDCFIDLLYGEHNASRAEIEERRARISEARRKAGQQGGRASGEKRRSKREAIASLLPKQNEALSDPLRSDPIQQTPPQPPKGGGGEGSTQREPQRESRASDVDRLGAFGMEAIWWSEGISKVTKVPCPPPQRFQLRDLSQALAHVFAGKKPEELEKAVRRSAEQYATNLRQGQGASVGGYVAWLAGGNYQAPTKSPAHRRLDLDEPRPAQPAEDAVTDPQVVEENIRKLNALAAAAGREGA